ncbi:MAG: ThiF family adenylyltransferase [Rhodocyclales bacterium]|nr:ThiF family adenylyltransferase [Rhodocyclales bacterium]
MKWAIDDPARFLRERSEIECLESQVDWLTTVWSIADGGLIAVDLDFAVHGRIFAGRMTYPDMFPHSPPYIRPRDASERWSAHQYGDGGSLCLQWRADNWQPQITGADMIRSAYELLSNEQHPEQPRVVPSAHRLTDGQAMRSTRQRFVATPELFRAWLALQLPSVTAFKTAKLYSLGTKLTIVMFVPEVSDAYEVMHKVPDLPAGISDSAHFFSLAGEGWLFRSDSFNRKASITSADELIQALTDAGLPTGNVLVQEEGKYKARMIALLGTEPDSLRTFFVEAGDQPGLSEFTVISPQPAKVRLPAGHDKLATLRIGIVGMGSIGSKIAISLARSGVRRFLLVDDDYLAPGNMDRHELSWAFVGVHKVEAVQEALTLIAPGVQVDTQMTRLAGQESGLTAATTLKDLSNCDLLIDATANSEVFLLLTAIAKQYRKPLCWGEVFAGGYGGLIARARPGFDPNPLAVRDAIHTHLATLPPAPYQNAAGYDVEQEQPLLAHDSDVGFVATALTRLALDTAKQSDLGDFPYSAYLIGMRREWIFEAPFDTRPIDVQGEGWNTGKIAASDEDHHAAVRTLLKFFEEAVSADRDPAA